MIDDLNMALEDLSSKLIRPRGLLELLSPNVLSVNVSLPRRISWNGREVTTGIFKEPTARRTKIRTLGLDGDGQADLTVHGGAGKAVYAYPSEHYSYWEQELQRSLPWGMFGENLTTLGLLEGSVHLGDRFRIGSAELTVTEPRFPCYKLGIKFGEMEMIERFMSGGRSGFYFSVSLEGEVTAGDPMILLAKGQGPTIATVFEAQQRAELEERR